jgi:hypothetical protein
VRLASNSCPQECTEKLFKEFQEEYYFKIREFHYFYLINECDPQELYTWVLNNQHADDASVGSRNYIQPSFGYQVIGPSPGSSITPLFQTIKTQDKLDENFYKVKDFLANQVKEVEASRTETVFKRQNFYKQEFQMSDAESYEKDPLSSLIAVLRKKLNAKYGALMKHKYIIRLRIHGLLLQSLNTGLVETLIKETFKQQTMSEVLKKTGESKMLYKEINHRIVESLRHYFQHEVSDESVEHIVSLLRFTQMSMRIHYTQFIANINQQLASFFNEYLLISPVSVIKRGFKLNRKFLLTERPEMFELILQTAEAQFKDLLSTESLDSLRLSYAKAAVIKEEERLKEQFKLTTKALLKTGLKYKYVPSKLKQTPILTVEFQDTLLFKPKWSGNTKVVRSIERNRNRAFLYEKESQTVEMVEEQISQFVEKRSSQKAKPASDPKSAENTSIPGGSIYSLLDIDKLLLRPKWPVSEIWQAFIALVFEHMGYFEEVDLYKVMHVVEKGSVLIQMTQEESVLSLKYPDYILKLLHSSAKEIFHRSFVGLCSALFVLDQFSFLFSQQSTLVDDILSNDMSTEEQVIELHETLRNEIDDLFADQKYISQSVPDQYSCGIFSVNLAVFKKKCLGQISDIFTNLKKSLIVSLKDYFAILEKNSLYISQIIKKKVESVEDYIGVKREVTSDKFGLMITKTENLSKGVGILLEALDVLGMAYDPIIIVKQIGLHADIRALLYAYNEYVGEFQMKKFEFYDEISLHKTEINREFDEL